MTARLLPFLVTVSVLVSPALAGDDPGAPEPGHRLSFALLGAWWSDLGDRSPVVPGYDSGEVGAFEVEGMGFEMTWFRLLRRGGGWRTWAGAEFGGTIFDNREEYLLYDAISGEAIEGQLEASLGWLGGGARWVGGRGRLRGVLGLGAGLYLFRVQEQIEDFGYADTGYDDEGPGGYGLLGIEYRFTAPLLLRVEVKRHLFDLGDADGLFPGQDLGGAMSTVALGVDWQLGAPR